ncbi:MAG TPA: hypothetical protein VHF23_09435 [Gaiellaceae bacterium]|nr:hypothetical protein [Gaiellaceae bacterium]
MRARLGLLPILAALPFLSGCLWWGLGAASSSESGSATATVAPPAVADPESAVRAAIPAIEAYYADNGTYAGMTLRLLRERYDAGLDDVRIVVRRNGARYCVEAPPRAAWAHYEGPAGPVAPGPCGGRGLSSPPLLPPAAQTLHAAVRGMYAYRSRHGTYEGVTARELRRLVPRLDRVRVVEIGHDSFCLESGRGAETFSARESGDVGAGRC